MAISREPANARSEEENDAEKYTKPSQRKKVVVVGLGMVGIAFMYGAPSGPKAPDIICSCADTTCGIVRNL